MTAKSTTQRKTRRKAPSAAELKRQVAAEKQRGDQALVAVDRLTNIVEGLASKVEDLSKLPTREQALAQHDQNEQVINTVLNEEIDTDNFPARPDANLPDNLVQVSKEFDRQRMAVNNPVQIRDTIDTQGEDIGQLEERPMRTHGPAEGSLAPIRAVDDAIVIENKRYSKDKLDHEMFMHEHMLVKVHDSTDETQIPMPLSTNGGRNQYFVRGEAQWVRRLYMEPLARAKKTTYTQRKVRHENGDETYIQVPHTALMYPFEVLEDTPRGKQWLRGILAEPY